MAVHRLSYDFGEGWLTRPAADLIRAAVTVAGFPPGPTVRRVAAAVKPGRRGNIRTAERVLGELSREAD